MNQSDLDHQEQLELDRLADELEASFKNPTLSDGFADLLQARLQEHPWSFRGAIQNNRVLRLAASLLVITTVVGPISALVVLIINAEPEKSVVPIWDLPTFEEALTQEVQPKDDLAVPPLDTSLEEAFGLDWHEAVAQSNRMALIMRQWTEANQDVAFDTPAMAPGQMNWTDADLDAIQSEFERRCLLGISSPPPSSLAERILQLPTGVAEGQAWISAWQWVLNGPGVDAPVFF
ncbi:MAG: hypothetical protein HQ519_06295 [Planctomycetes bacterium]|nr:hypothetical protein [Planctomycetota bacterium]